jgi:folate-binding protein YgfZ
MLTDSYESNDVMLTDSFGVRYPAAFTHPAAEYRALTTTAALLDLRHWGVLRLTGRDNVRLLNSLTTNDATAVEPGRACHSALTTIKGKLVAELYVLRREAELLVLVAQGDRHAVTAAIDKHIIADDVAVEDVSDDYGAVSVEGPKSRDVVWRLFPGDGQLPGERLEFVDTDYLGTPVTILRGGVSGENGYHLVAPSGGIRRLRDYLIQSGRADDAAPAGLAAWNMRRVEAGLPWWGSDVGAEENFPKECRLDGIVSYEKGCYLGQETLARMHHRGHPNWLLVGLVPDGDLPGVETPAFITADADEESTGKDAAVEALRALDLSSAVPPGTELYAPGEPDKAAGRITSPVFSPKLQKPLLLGYVRTALAEPGARLALRRAGVEATLVVTPLPVE